MLQLLISFAAQQCAAVAHMLSTTSNVTLKESYFMRSYEKIIILLCVCLFPFLFRLFFFFFFTFILGGQIIRRESMKEGGIALPPSGEVHSCNTNISWMRCEHLATRCQHYTASVTLISSRGRTVKCTLCWY